MVVLYIHYGPVIFYGGSYSGSTQASVVIKNRSGDQWGPAGADGAPRNRSCSFSIDTNNSDMDVYFRITVGDLSSAHALNEQKVSISIPVFNAPTAPTWTNINPNPCNINSAPIISWGGAQAGSSGIIVYDVEVKSTLQSGGWTEWLRLANSIQGTSYTNVVLSQMSVYGQKPYVGVKYKYRIRVWDGISQGSPWAETSELSVNFEMPTPPTTVAFAQPTVKKNKLVRINWSGATGGSGNITSYTLELYLTTNPNSSSYLEKWTRTGTGEGRFIEPDIMFKAPKNGEYIKAIVYTNNSWGQQSKGSVPVSIIIKGNAIWIKVNGNWKEGECWVKVNGNWKEGSPYIKVNGIWKESI